MSEEAWPECFRHFFLLHVLLVIEVWGFGVLNLAEPRCAGSDRVILQEVLLALEV